MNTRVVIDIASDLEELINDGDYISLRPMLQQLGDKHGLVMLQFVLEFLAETADWVNEDAQERFNALWEELDTLSCEKA